LAVPASCPAQNYTVAISSSSTSSPGNSPFQTAILTVPQGPDFTLSVSIPQSVPQGGAANYTISVTPVKRLTQQRIYIIYVWYGTPFFRASCRTTSRLGAASRIEIGCITGR
jgi:hypothetical protein